MSEVDLSPEEMVAVSMAVEYAIKCSTDPEFLARMPPEVREAQKRVLPVMESAAEKLNLWLTELKPELEEEVGPTPLILRINQLALSRRTSRCLEMAGIHTVGDLVNCTVFDLLKINSFGRKSLIEIKELLASLGLSLKPGEHPLAVI